MQATSEGNLTEAARGGFREGRSVPPPYVYSRVPSCATASAYPDCTSTTWLRGRPRRTTTSPSAHSCHEPPDRHPASS